MINHARNLLMNVKQGGFQPDFPGEEYIPETFVPRKLNRPLRLARQLLFGENPDRLYLNYRARQIMMLLHSTEMESYVYDLDPRVTYVPFSDTDLFNDVFGMTINQIGGEGDRLYVRGQHEPNEAQGQIDQFWDVIVTSPTTVRVDKRRLPFNSKSVNLDYSSGMCQPIQLTGSGLTIQFHPVATGTRWQIQSRVRPATDLGMLLPGIVNAFGGQGDQAVFPPLAPEPVATFERVWRQNELAPYRYSALLLAMIWRINQLPQQEEA